MPFTRTIPVILGSGLPSETLRAQLVDTTGANVGLGVTTGFVNLGAGNYLWHYADFPDGHRGGVKFLKNSDGTLYAFEAVNPEGIAENTNAKTTAAVTLPTPAPTGYGGGSSTIYGSSGAVDFVYTVFDTDGTTPLPGASVYVSADSAGVQRSQTKVTDALGRVTFTLVPSTVYFWRSHVSRAFVNPDSEVVGP